MVPRHMAAVYPQGHPGDEIIGRQHQHGFGNIGVRANSVEEMQARKGIGILNTALGADSNPKIIIWFTRSERQKGREKTS